MEEDNVPTKAVSATGSVTSSDRPSLQLRYAKKTEVKVSLCRDPVSLQCYNCHQFITTKTEKTLSSAGLILVFVLFLLTIILCWIPCLLDKCKDIKHTCPICGAIIGISTMNSIAEARRRRSSWVKPDVVV